MIYMSQQMELDELTHEQLQEAIDKKIQAFYVAQGKNESNINAYLTRVFELYDEEPGIFAGVTMPSGRTAREVLPSMFAEPFDPVQYDKERTALKDFEKEVLRIGDEYNRKALKECL